jgi:Ni/Fe-hydrogenase subunit HybB-like protein
MNQKINLIDFFIGITKLALKGSSRYYAWLAALLVLMLLGAYTYTYQWVNGLILTGMRDQVSWGFYIANFTFLVGVAAAGVMIVIPAYIYNYKLFKEITILGELLAASAIIMVLTFVIADLGLPERAFHLMPFLGTPNFPRSILTWDVLVLNGYLILNLIIPGYILYKAFKGERLNKKLLLPVIFLSIPWAISIHTVTAFLYGGLGARPFWNTAVMAPRFLASAFTAGPALIIIVSLVVRKYTNFNIKDKAIFKLSEIVAIAMVVNLFLFGSEIYTIMYAATSHVASLEYLFFGLHENTKLVVWTWASLIMDLTAFFLLLYPKTRKNFKTLTLASILAFFGVWIEKGMGLVIPGFIPTPLGEVWEYWPTFPEAIISLAIWALGFFVYTIMLKVAISIETGEFRKQLCMEEECETETPHH